MNSPTSNASRSGSRLVCTFNRCDIGLHPLAQIGRLPRLKRLTSLRLGNTKCTVTEMRELAPLKQLISLDLYEIEVTDAGIKELASLTQFTSLDLFRTNVTDVGLEALQKAFPRCRIDR